MIKIGISSCFMYPDPSRPVFGPKTLSYIENDMAHYLTQKGILPVLIPPVEENLMKDIVREMDGFVFQGGTDLAPESYGEKPIGQWKGDATRDAYELKLFDMAFKSDKPILGICRGMQLMNVYFGGTLYQDTKTQRPEVEIHRDADLYDNLYHEVTFTPHQLMAKIYPDAKNPMVNSIHHQSIKNLGKNLAVVAESTSDGIIEAIEYTHAPSGWISGVQWHPEFSHTLGDKVLDPHKLYNHFLAEVKSLKADI
ncbi:MAG: gamma-glutamyl-gamma-aminobutyrate hydrolase family protein [Cyclobacteriaceae bacterium]